MNKKTDYFALLGLSVIIFIIVYLVFFADYSDFKNEKESNYVIIKKRKGHIGGNSGNARKIRKKALAGSGLFSRFLRLYSDFGNKKVAIRRDKIYS
jgi:hypothetical protein